MIASQLGKAIQHTFNPDFVYKFVLSSGYSVPPLRKIKVRCSYQFSPKKGDFQAVLIKSILNLESLFPQRPKFSKIFVTFRYKKSYSIYNVSTAPNFLLFLSVLRFLARAPIKQKSFFRGPLVLQDYFFTLLPSTELVNFHWSHYLTCRFPNSEIFYWAKTSFID